MKAMHNFIVLWLLQGEYLVLTKMHQMNSLIVLYRLRTLCIFLPKGVPSFRKEFDSQMESANDGQEIMDEHPSFLIPQKGKFEGGLYSFLGICSEVYP